MPRGVPDEGGGACRGLAGAVKRVTPPFNANERCFQPGMRGSGWLPLFGDGFAASRHAVKNPQ